METINIWCDGGAKPNPGKGYGSFEVASSTFNHVEKEIPFGNPLTNNQCEYLSLIHALRWVNGQRSNLVYPEFDLEIWTDSKVMRGQVNGEYCVHVERLVPLHAEVHDFLNTFSSWKVHWHRRKNSVVRFGH